MKNTISKSFATILVLTASLAYGTLSTTVKLAYKDGFSVGEMVFGQISLAFIFMLCFALSKDLSFLSKIKRQTIFILIGAGSISSLTTIFYNLCLQYVSASLAIILLFQFTWIGILLDYIFNKVKPSRLRIIALFIILSGTYLALNITNQTLAVHPLGLVFGLASAFSYSFFIYFSGTLATDIPIIYKNSIMLFGSLFVATIFFPPVFLFTISDIKSSFFLYSFYLASFGMIMPFYFFAKGVPVIGTTAATLIGALELPTVLIGATLILGESISLIQITGISLIILGIFISTRTKISA